MRCRIQRARTVYRSKLKQWYGKARPDIVVRMFHMAMDLGMIRKVKGALLKWDNAEMKFDAASATLKTMLASKPEKYKMALQLQYCFSILLAESPCTADQSEGFQLQDVAKVLQMPVYGAACSPRTWTRAPSPLDVTA